MSIKIYKDSNANAIFIEDSRVNGKKTEWNAGVFFGRPSFPASTSTVVSVTDSESGNLSTIYSDRDGAAKSNPFSLSSAGVLNFNADPGRYNVTATQGSDSQAWENIIIKSESIGVQFLNSLQASSDGSNCKIESLSEGFEVISYTIYSDFVDKNGSSYGANAVDVANALNAIFVDSGATGDELPQITSSLAVSIVEGETLNYELVADYGVAYEWDLSNVSGVATVEGNVRKLIGGSSLAVANYDIPVKAINYNGEDSETLVLTVSNPAFSDTKSVNFTSTQYLDASASSIDGIFGRPGSGAGSSDAWTISMYYKPSAYDSTQTIMYFGDTFTANGGIRLTQEKQSSSNPDTRFIRLTYGGSSQYVRVSTSPSSVESGVWCHLMITYDGGTTTGGTNTRFKIFIDGSEQTLSYSRVDGGWGIGIDDDIFRVGKYANSTNTLQNDARIDELSIWGSDQSSNIIDIYNSGDPFDLSTLTTQPDHWWRMGDGDTYSNLLDSGDTGGITFVMYNMTAANIVSDTP